MSYGIAKRSFYEELFMNLEKNMFMKVHSSFKIKRSWVVNDLPLS